MYDVLSQIVSDAEHNLVVVVDLQKAEVNIRMVLLLLDLDFQVMICYLFCSEVDMFSVVWYWNVRMQILTHKIDFVLKTNYMYIN